MKGRFEWDLVKAAANLKKHRVSFEEAITIFDDPDRLLLPDPWHTTAREFRELALGTSDRNRQLLVVYTERGPNVTRLISARRATGPERRRYHENQAKNWKAQS